MAQIEGREEGPIVFPTDFALDKVDGRIVKRVGGIVHVPVVLGIPFAEVGIYQTDGIPLVISLPDTLVRFKQDGGKKAGITLLCCRVFVELGQRQAEAVSKGCRSCLSCPLPCPARLAPFLRTRERRPGKGRTRWTAVVFSWDFGGNEAVDGLLVRSYRACPARGRLHFRRSFVADGRRSACFPVQGLADSGLDGGCTRSRGGQIIDNHPETFHVRGS